VIYILVNKASEIRKRRCAGFDISFTSGTRMRIGVGAVLGDRGERMEGAPIVCAGAKLLR
jgi:hypothetical protein